MGRLKDAAEEDEQKEVVTSQSHTGFVWAHSQHYDARLIVRNRRRMDTYLQEEKSEQLLAPPLY
jgi:ABC-type phosphate/phosphonate transport system substrate-binding protein